MTINYISKIDKNLKKHISDVNTFKDILYQNNAYIAGGFILSAITDFFKSSDIDIYVPEKHFNSLITDIQLLGGDIYQFNRDFPIFMSDFNNLSIHSGCKSFIVSSEYDSSFFKKNNIKFKVEVNFKKIKCDIMVVGNNKTVLDVVKNFDLTCCQLWYNGKTFDGTHIKQTLNKQTYLNADYVMSLMNGNDFIKNRLGKYTSRGFEVTLSPSKYKAKSIIKTISNIDAYVVKMVIIYYINNFMSILLELTSNYNYDAFFLRNILNRTEILRLNDNSKQLTCINKCKLYFKLLETNKNQYKVLYNVLLEYYNSFRTFSVKELFCYTFMYFGVDFKNVLTSILSLFKNSLSELIRNKRNYGNGYRSPEQWPLRVQQNKKIIAHIKSILADKSDYSPKILLKDQLKTIKDEFNLDVDTRALDKANVDNVDLDNAGYDVIEMESIKISEHIGKDHKNICFIPIDENNNINYNNISFTTITNLSIFFMDMNSGWFYECGNADTMRDIDKSIAYVKIPLNYTIYVSYIELYRAINKQEQIIFFQKTSTLNNTVTHDNAYPNHHLSNPNHVSAYHCQTGSNIDVYTLLRYGKSSKVSNSISSIPSKNKTRKDVKSVSLSSSNSKSSSISPNTIPEWINIKKLNKDTWYHISKNPQAINFLKTHKTKVSLEGLLANTNLEAYELFKKILEENPKISVDIEKICNIETDTAIEFLTNYITENEKKHIKKIDWEKLYINPNPKAFEIIFKYKDHMLHKKFVIFELYDNFKTLMRYGEQSKFKDIFETIMQNMVQPNFKKIFETIMQNRNQPKYKEFLSQNEFNWKLLSYNKSDKAVELVIKHIIDNNLNQSEIPRSFYGNTNNKVIEYLKQYKDKINWLCFSHNKNAKAIDMIIEYIKTDTTTNINKINLGALFVNDNKKIFKLIKEHFEILEYYHFNNLLKNEKLDINVNTFIIDNFDNIRQKYINIKHQFWDSISANKSPEIIEILRKYPEKINFEIFAKNTNDKAIDVMLENEQYLLNQRRYFWQTISSNSNPRILKFLEKNKEKLDINVVVQNPLFVKFNTKRPSYKSI